MISRTIIYCFKMLLEFYQNCWLCHVKPKLESEISGNVFLDQHWVTISNTQISNYLNFCVTRIPSLQAKLCWSADDFWLFLFWKINHFTGQRNYGSNWICSPAVQFYIKYFSQERFLEVIRIRMCFCNFHTKVNRKLMSNV